MPDEVFIPHTLDAALAAYQRARDEAALPGYEQARAHAAFAPFPPEALAARAAQRARRPALGGAAEAAM